MNILQKDQWWFLDAQKTGGVAGFVERHLLVQRSTNIGDTENVDDEIGEFVETIGNALSTDRPLWFVSQDLHVLMLHCERAGAGKADDGFCIFDRFDRVLDGSLGSFDVAGVDQRLAAADLFFRHGDVTAETFEHLNSGNADLWIEHIHHALGK